MSSARELFFDGVLAASLAVAGCSGTGVPLIEEGPFDHPTIGELTGRVEPKFWSVINIPANDIAVDIANVESLQTSDVGLRRLYLAGSGESPLVFIYADWDPDKTNRDGDSLFILQDYKPDFTPADFSLEEAKLPPTISTAQKQYFQSIVRPSTTK